MLCLMCGQDNPEGLTVCPKCNAPIINNSKVSSAPPKKGYDRYFQIKAAADGMLEGGWSIEEYESYLKNIISILTEKEAEIRKTELTEEEAAEFADELNCGFHGISLYNAGLALMLSYVNTHDENNITDGLNMVYAGNESINEAMRINRENRKRLEELYIDTEGLMN